MEPLTLPMWAVLLIAAFPTIAAIVTAITTYYTWQDTHETKRQMIELTVNTNHIKDELIETTKALALLQGEAAGQQKEKARAQDERNRGK